MKKVLIFSLVYDQRFVGGAEIAVQEITGRISPERASFHMITLRCDSNLPREERVGNIRLFRVGFGKKNPSIADLSRFPLSLNKYLFPFLGCLKALMLERKYGYDVTWSIMANYAGFGALFFNFFYPKIAFILTLQEGDPIPYIKRRVRFVYPLFQRLFRSLRGVRSIVFQFLLSKDCLHSSTSGGGPNSLHQEARAICLSTVPAHLYPCAQSAGDFSLSCGICARHGCHGAGTRDSEWGR